MVKDVCGLPDIREKGEWATNSYSRYVIFAVVNRCKYLKMMLDHPSEDDEYTGLFFGDMAAAGVQKPCLA